MKILVISNLFPPYYMGGYEVVCAQTCLGLRNLNHEVVVLTSDAEGVKESAGIEHNIRVIDQLKLYVPFDRPAPLLRKRRWETGRHNYQTTKKVIEEEQPDIIFM